MGARTYDDGKPPLARLPLKALREVALVQHLRELVESEETSNTKNAPPLVANQGRR